MHTFVHYSRFPLRSAVLIDCFGTSPDRLNVEGNADQRFQGGHRRGLAGKVVASAAKVFMILCTSGLISIRPVVPAVYRPN